METPKIIEIWSVIYVYATTMPLIQNEGNLVSAQNQVKFSLHYIEMITEQFFNKYFLVQ